jgi:hypothetical protein
MILFMEEKLLRKQFETQQRPQFEGESFDAQPYEQEVYTEGAVEADTVEEAGSVGNDSGEGYAQPAQSIIQVQKSPQLQAIEGVLEKDMKELYKNLPDHVKPEFKRVGEETASQIDQLIRDAQVTVRKIVKLISQWLKLIPGVNKYYITQTSKIKADEIIKGMETHS